MSLKIEYSKEKNILVKATRGVSFKDIEIAISKKHILDVIDHPSPVKYKNQQMLIVKINNYAYCVPFVVKDSSTIFLKTLYPSRKFTKLYLKSEK